MKLLDNLNEASERLKVCLVSSRTNILFHNKVPKGKKRKIQWWRRRWIEGECFACEENLMERNEKEKKKECCRKEEEEREGKLEKKIRERDI